MPNPNGSSKRPAKKFDENGNLICVRCEVLLVKNNRYCRHCSETRHLWNEKVRNYYKKVKEVKQ